MSETESNLSLFDIFMTKQSDIFIGMPTLTLNSVEKHQLSKLRDEEFMLAISGLLLQLHPKTNNKDEPYLNDNSILGELGKFPISDNHTLRDMFQLYIINNLVSSVTDEDVCANQIDLSKLVEDYIAGNVNFIDTVRAIPHGVDNYLFHCNRATMYCMLHKKAFM